MFALLSTAAPTATASQIISTSSVSDLQLGVNSKGEAMLSYLAHGKAVHVLAWGAENAVPTPRVAPEPADSTLQLFYDGGYTKYFREDPSAQAAIADLRRLQDGMARATAAKDNPTRWALKPEIATAYQAIASLRTAATNYWQTFSCPTFQGMPLKGVVVSCTAPDGSSWALESSRIGSSGAAVSVTGLELVHWTGGDPANTTPRGITSSSASIISLGVNDRGEAMVNYRAQGRVYHVLASTAAPPQVEGQQVSFQLAYDGGYTKYFRQSSAAQAALVHLRALQDQMTKATTAKDNPTRWTLKPEIAAAYAAIASLRREATQYWKTFSCPAYSGPAITDMVVACTAPDGSYWAVQSWDRDLPDYGMRPNIAQEQLEVHLAHWTGDRLPVLTVHTDWSYAGRWNHLWGTYTYDGIGVFGLASTVTGAPLDSFGRNVYVDTLDSTYGAGWRRENSFLTHGPGGTWCYSVNPHGSHPAGTGTQYRLTILGPGVAPDVSITVSAASAYDVALQRHDDAGIVAMHDPSCVPHEGVATSTLLGNPPR